MTKHLLLSLSILLLALPCSQAADPAHIVFMIGEDEYRTWETLPAFAESDLKSAGYKSTIAAADAANKHHFPQLVAGLKDADLLFVSVRRRTPPKEQLDAVRAHLNAGKPLIGIRTASHAFALRPKDKLSDPSLDVWQAFDPEVLGGNYTNHHGAGPKTAISVALGAESHPILKGISIPKLIGNGSLYKVSPLAPGAKPLLIGTIPEKPPEPVAWTHLYGPKKARILYTSLGHADDFQNPEFRRLLLNAAAWSLQK